MFNRIFSTNIKKMYLIGFLGSFDLISASLKTFFTTWAGMSNFEMMFIQSLFSIFVAFLEIPTGRLSDTKGRVFSLTLGFAAMAVGFGMYTIIPAMWWFIIAEFVLALGITLRSGTDEAIIKEEHELAKEKYMSTFNRYKVRQSQGRLLSGVLGSELVRFFSLAAPFAFMFFPMVIGAFLSSRITTVISEAKPKIFLTEGIKVLRSDAQLILVTFDKIVVYGLCFLMIWFYQGILEYHQVDLWWFGKVHSLLVLTQIVTYSLLSRCNQSTSLRSILTLLGFLPVIGFLVSYISMKLPSGSEIGILLGIIGPSIVVGAGLPRRDQFSDWVNVRLQNYHRVTVLSTIALLSALFLFPIKLIAGFVADTNYALLMLGTGMVLLLWMLLPHRFVMRRL